MQAALQQDALPQNASQKYLTFKLGAEEYGIDIMRVMEIRGWTETTRLPSSPEFVLGVINLRGVVVPVLDMRLRFGMPPAELTPQSVVIILYSHERTMGILVDGVSDILDVRTSEIKAPPPMSHTIEEDFLAGLVSVETRMVVLLAPDRLLSERLLQHAELALHASAQTQKSSS